MNSFILCHIVVSLFILCHFIVLNFHFNTLAILSTFGIITISYLELVGVDFRHHQIHFLSVEEEFTANVSSFDVSLMPKPFNTEKTAAKVQLALPFSIRDRVLMPTPHSAAQSANLIPSSVRFALISCPSIPALSINTESGISETVTFFAMILALL